MKKYVRPLTASVMAVVLMVLYLTAYRHVIIFHEQHHLFVFTCDYAGHILHQKGLLWFLTEFVVQFGYWPWLGAAVWTLMIVGAYLMTQSIIRRLTGWRDMLQVSAIVPCWMFYKTLDMDVVPTAAVGAFLVVSGAWILALVAGHFRRPKKRGDAGGKAWWLLTGPALFGVWMLFFSYRYYAPRTITMPSGQKRELTRQDIEAQRQAERLMIKADQAVRRRDWPEAQRLAEEALAGGRRNHLMSYFRSMALYHQGTLNEQFFDYPQMFGLRALFFPWKADRNQAEYGGYIYEQLGALNAAIHWEFEALTGWGETAQHLNNLAKFYIATGKPRQAEKFIYPLAHTLFYRKDAERLRGYIAGDTIEGLHNAFADTPASPGRWDSVDNLNADLVYLVSEDRDNRMAQQYLLLGLLLENNVGAFYENLKIIYPKGSSALPAIYQQALCLYRLGHGAEQIAADGFEISAETEREMQVYLEEHRKGKMARFTPAQKRTYWYYIHFLSPAGQTVNV